MYDVSELWRALIAEPYHSFEVKVAINGVEYGSDYIRSLNVERSVFSGSNLGVGACTSAEINLVIDKPSETIPVMAAIEPFVRVTDGSDLSDQEGHHSEWIPQGVFYIDTREVTQNDDGMPIITFHGYDAMLKTEQLYPDSSMEFPADDTDVVQEIADTIGVTVDSRTWDAMTYAYPISLPAGYSMREVLGNIAAMYAGNWVMTFDGELLLVTIGGLPPETNYLVDSNDEPITFGGDRILV